jgi:dolichol-phosphate mannosyltransferase
MSGRDFSAVIPVLNEAEHLPTLLSELQSVANSPDGSRLVEAVFVDDGSRDGTRERLKESAAAIRLPRIVLVFRDVKEGTVSAEIAGFKAASSELVVKLDGDGQHPVSAIPQLVDSAAAKRAPIAVASRYVPGAGVNWNRHRGVVSRIARFVAKSLIPPARRLHDPLSGFFVANRSLVAGLPSRADSYKLLLYVLAANHVEEVVEVPFVMGKREGGRSKIMSWDFRFLLGFLREVLAYSKVYREGATSARPWASEAQEYSGNSDT